MSNPDVSIKSMRSFFVGGRTAILEGLPVESRSMVFNGAPRKVDPNGEHTYGQMYVQEYRLASPRQPEPVLLWHGGGMTGCTWETTPDGRDGWLWRLLQSGYDVMVSDAVERGRSSWARYPDVYREAPVFRPRHEGWTTFRIGPRYDSDPSLRLPFPGQRFPVEHFDYFTNQWVPRWPNHDAMILDAYTALVDRVGPCHIVAHSQGAGYAAEIARRRPGGVRSVVCIEPGGMPMPGAMAGLPPHLVVWGDFIEASGSHWIGYRAQAEHYFRALNGATKIDVLDLPSMGITGNSHLPMLDTNSEEVFQLVLQWLRTSQTK